MKIGVMGTGNIAQYLLDSINNGRQADGKITAVFGRNRNVGEGLAEEYGIGFFTDLEAFLREPLDIIVEAATLDVAADNVKAVLESKKDIIIGSIGAFKDAAFLEDVRQAARANGCLVHLPSGAIGGLDLLKSANSMQGLKEVSITTRKSPASLGLEGITEETVLFDGPAGEAIGKFPKNVNVALVLSIAGIGTEKTRVRVIADPDADRNTHQIRASGEFGKMELTIENTPMPANPKTSYLAALSILSVLQGKGDPVVIG